MLIFASLLAIGVAALSLSRTWPTMASMLANRALISSLSRSFSCRIASSSRSIDGVSALYIQEEGLVNVIIAQILDLRNWLRKIHSTSVKIG